MTHNSENKMRGTDPWGRDPRPHTTLKVIELPQRKKPSKLTQTKAAISSLAIDVRRDMFRDQIELGGAGLPNCYAGRVSPNALTWIRNAIDDRFPVDPGKEVRDAVEGLAEENRFNPVSEMLEALSWDQVQRLDDWLPRITGAENTALNRAVGCLVIMAMVARALYPGTKFDLCLILEGEQGSGKSSLVRLLAGIEFFTDAPGLLAMDAKARGELLAGRSVVEIAELAGMSKTETEMVKAIITQTHDHYREAFQPVAKAQPRTCVFIGTTNSTSSYLPDSTGNRRFVPVRCAARIDLRLFESEREQLLAEAYVRVMAMANQHAGAVRGRPLPLEISFELPEHLRRDAAQAAENRRIVDHGEDVLRLLLPEMISRPGCKRMSNNDYFLSSAEILDALRHRVPHPPTARILAQWMAKIGWYDTRRGSSKSQIRGYAVAP